MPQSDQSRGHDPQQPNRGKDQSQQTGGNLGDTARQFIQGAREQAEAGGAALSSGMRNLADSLRHGGPHEGMMGSAAAGLADTLERGGQYLEQEGLGGLVEDLGTLIRRNPLPAVLVSIGVGFLFAQMFRSER